MMFKELPVLGPDSVTAARAALAASKLNPAKYYDYHLALMHAKDIGLDNVLKVAGENVSTVEVELVLSQHAKVLEAAVVGQPDEVRDEVPVAFIVARDPSDPPSVDELFEWCRARLGKAKQPRSITLLPELPRTSVGKIRKFLLRENDMALVAGEQS